MKISLAATELFHADGRTDMTKFIVAFRVFAKAPKKGAKLLSPQILTPKHFFLSP
jgi:hypothetical protein